MGYHSESKVFSQGDIQASVVSLMEGSVPGLGGQHEQHLPLSGERSEIIMCFVKSIEPGLSTSPPSPENNNNNKKHSKTLLVTSYEHFVINHIIILIRYTVQHLTVSQYFQSFAIFPM